MAIVCDFCPHEVDGKFSLAEAQLATTAISVGTAHHPTIDKAACDDHYEDMVVEPLEGHMPGDWVTMRVMKVEQD